MNESSSNLFYAVLPYILRCFIPLVLLFGVSYLLRRLGLVAIESPEPGEGTGEKSTEVPDKVASSPTTPSKKTQKGKAVSSRKKSVEKKSASSTKTGNSRSRSK